MKKMMFLLLAVCLLTVLPLQAAAAVETAVKASAAGVKPGQRITFTVEVSGGSDIKSIGVVPLYSKDHFTLVEGKWLVSGILSDFDMEKELGVLAFLTGTKVDSQIFTFTLCAKEAAALGAQQIESTVVLMDGNNTRTELTASAATITIGDVPDASAQLQQQTGEAPDIPAWIWGGGIVVVCLSGVVTAALLIKKSHSGR